MHIKDVNLDFKTKTFIVFLSLSFIAFLSQNLIALFSSITAQGAATITEYLPFIIQTIAYSLIYSLAIYFLVKKRVLGWALGAIPSIWILIDPTKIGISSLHNGLLPAFFNFLSVNDTIRATTAILSAITPLLVIVFCIFSIVLNKNKKLDMYIGLFFIIAVGLSLITKQIYIFSISGQTDIISGSISNIITEFFFFILFLSTVVLWHFDDKVLLKKQNP